MKTQVSQHRRGIRSRHSPDSRPHRGFTIVEMLMAMGIGGILLAVLATSTLYFATSFAMLSNHCDLQGDSRTALQTFKSDVRQAIGVASFNGTTLVLTNSDASTVTFAFNQNARTFTRTKNGVSKVLLDECADLQILLFQRNPANGVYDYFPAADAATCKLISLNWNLTRQTPQLPANGEWLQSTKVVIRQH